MIISLPYWEILVSSFLWLTVHVIVSHTFGKGQTFSWSSSHCPQLWSISCWFRYVPVMSQEVSMRPFGSVVKRWRTTVPAGLRRKHQKFEASKDLFNSAHRPRACGLWTCSPRLWNSLSGICVHTYYAPFSISRIRTEKHPEKHVFSCMLSSFLKNPEHVIRPPHVCRIGRIRLLHGMPQRLCAWLLRSNEKSESWWKCGSGRIVMNFTCFLHRKSTKNNHTVSNRWCSVDWGCFDVYFIFHVIFPLVTHWSGVWTLYRLSFFFGLGMTGISPANCRTVCQGAIFIIMLMGLEELGFRPTRVQSFLTCSFMICESTFFSNMSFYHIVMGI